MSTCWHGQLAPTAADESLVFVDVDDTIIEVHGYQKQGAGFGYSGVRGINALLATVSTVTTAPVITGQRLRKGTSGSPRGAARIVTDALKTVTRPPSLTARVLLRADSAYYGFATVSAALKAGADVSITAGHDPAANRAIGAIPEDAWTPIEPTDAISDTAPTPGFSKQKSPRSFSPHSRQGRRKIISPGASWSDESSS